MTLLDNQNTIRVSKLLEQRLGELQREIIGELSRSSKQHDKLTEAGV